MSELAQYGLLLLFALSTVGVVMLIWLLANHLGTSRKATAITNARPAESGNLISKPAWRRYHVQYYVFLLLFLAFDMEMAFMYPWAIVFRQLGLEAFIDMGIFLIVLFLGLLYAWSQKGLKRS